MAKLKDYAAAVGIIVTMPLMRPTPAQRVIREMGDAFSMAMRISLGDEANRETPAQWVARVEHELMIEGHETDCKKCQDDAFRRSPQGRALSFVDWWYTS